MDQVRTIEAGAPPARFARGWHCLGLAARFRDGGPHAVQAFGTKLAVFADSSGDLHVLDGYCRHMGGDLTMGTIKGDQVACPFHDWRWDSILVENSNCREVVDNVVDMAHFFYIHFAFPTYFKNVLEGHVAAQYLNTKSRPDVGGGTHYSETTLKSQAAYYGPSYM